MKEIFKQGGPAIILIFIFVVIVCAIMPGFIVAKTLFPDRIQEGVKGMVYIGMAAASPAFLPSFVILSVWGYIQRGAGGLERFIADFTFAGFTCFLSYLPAIALVSLFNLSIIWFAVLVILLWLLSLWRFMVIPRAQ